MIDPAGLEMLNSVVEILKLVGLEMKDLNIEVESFDENTMSEAVQKSGKCPVIQAMNVKQNGTDVHHAMVVTGIKPKRMQIPGLPSIPSFPFLQCKNSFRSDPTEPGTY